MSEGRSPDAQGEVSIGADPDRVYALITDLATLADLAEEATAMEWRNGGVARPGAVFKGHNQNGWRRWTTTCTVTEAEPGRVFAFDVRHSGLLAARWRYDIESAGIGCRVTERTWDHRPRWIRNLAGVVVGVPDRAAANNVHIGLTLQRLKAKAESARRPG